MSPIQFFKFQIFFQFLRFLFGSFFYSFQVGWDMWTSQAPHVHISGMWEETGVPRGPMQTWKECANSTWVVALDQNQFFFSHHFIPKSCWMRWCLYLFIDSIFTYFIDALFNYRFWGSPTLWLSSFWILIWIPSHFANPEFSPMIANANKTIGFSLSPTSHLPCRVGRTLRGQSHLSVALTQCDFLLSKMESSLVSACF